MNFVNEFGEKRNGFAEVVRFVMRRAGISTDFYYKGLIKIGAKPAFSIWHRGLICEGYWKVNSRRSIFRIADPT